MSVFGRNQEGYPDPTAAEAIAKASKKKYLSLVYMASKCQQYCIWYEETHSDGINIFYSIAQKRTERTLVFRISGR